MNLRNLRLRIVERLEERLIVRPLIYVFAAIVLSQLTLAIDRDLSDDDLPTILKTSVDSANSILSTIAGGLITVVALLLSLVLVTVQLASSQFSPRTLRDWIGDTTQQRTIGIVLGTTVFCLLALRESRSLGESTLPASHVSVLVAVFLAVVSLIAVVRSVDHLSHSMRIGSVARDLAQETLAALRALGEDMEITSDPIPGAGSEFPPDPPIRSSGTPLTAPQSGWVERVDIDAVRDRLGPDAHVSVVVGTGSFVYEGQPVAWLAPGTDPTHDSVEDFADEIVDTMIEIGQTRLVSEDVSFGLLQMSDIALRAISPGVNDPNTAVDVVAHMGMVLLEAWSQPPSPSRLRLDDNITIDLTVASHADYLDIAFSQILRYASSEFEVLTAMKRTLETIIAERSRRELPGPLEPLEDMLDEIHATVRRSQLSTRDKSRFD